jgi:Leucine-rich repeat (LRR) protein
MSEGCLDEGSADPSERNIGANENLSTTEVVSGDAAHRRSSKHARQPLPQRKPIYQTFAHATEIPVGVHPLSLRVHPKGFRLLQQSSPLERRMNTYFRVPPRPTKRQVLEQRKLQKMIRLEIELTSKSSEGVLLDGFMLLEACGVQDPSDARECVLNDSNIVSAAREDLSYFSHLRFLDLGENGVRLRDLIPLQGLEELHLHCNGITDLDELDEPSGNSRPPFPRLSTLNLSFNRVPASSLAQLGSLGSLERLDLSSNKLKTLPADMSFLSGVTQLALENNKFATPDVILALSTMPSLVEVNLNHNEFSAIPRLSVRDGSGVCFPVLEVIGLASNSLTYFEDVYALTQISTLRRMVLWGNPVERRMKDCEILIYEFGSMGVQVVLENPIPPKRAIGEFYAANATNFLAVSDKDLKSLPSANLRGQKPQEKASAEHSQGPTGPSFFVTQTDVAQEQPPPKSGGELGKQRGRHLAATQDDSAAWLDSQADDNELLRRARPGNSARASSVTRTESERDQQRDPPSSAPAGIFDHETDVDGDFPDWGMGAPTTLSSGICRPNANVRSVMTELKRMLRQPLPPIHVPQFEQSTISRSNKKR